MLLSSRMLSRLALVAGVAVAAFPVAGGTAPAASAASTTRPAAAAAPVTPRQVSPPDGQVYTHYPRTTTLTWGTVSGAARYRVEIQCLSCQTAGAWSTWTTATTTSSSYSFTWVGDNYGRWRVTALGSDGTASSASGWRRFYYQTATGQPLPSPMLLSPADGSVFGHYPRTTTLTWGPVEGAASYLLEIEYCDPSGCATWSEPYGPYSVAGTDYTFDFVGAQPGRWRVRAINSAGTTGRVSAWSNFRYTV